jgi:hypothetical protein
MIDWLVRTIFRFNSLREAIFEEVELYNYLGHIINDPESMQTASKAWDEGDGWRGWTKGEYKYYFNDIPEKKLADHFAELDKMEGVVRL